MGAMKFHTHEELLDDIWGKKGTLKRDEMEAKLQAEVESYYVGEAIRKARLAQHLTQEQLGERIGVQRAQISKLEKGKSITLASMSRVFKALGVTSAMLDLGKLGKVALW